MAEYTQESLQVLRERVQLFEAFSLTEVMQLLKRSKTRTVSDGLQFVREGNDATSMFIIITGRAVVSRRGDGGEEKLAVLEPGATVGEMALIDAAPRSATVTAQGDSVVLEVTRETIESGPPPLQRKIFHGLARILAERLRVANELMQEGLALKENQNKIDARAVRQLDMSGWNLSSLRAKRADLSCADLRGVNLRDADLRGADLRGVRLDGADLRHTDTSSALRQDRRRIVSAAPVPMGEETGENWEDLMKSLAHRAKHPIKE